MQPLIDGLLLFVSDLIKTLIGFIVGLWFFNKYLLPRMAPGMVKGIIETKEVQDLITRGRGVLDKLEPFIEKIRGLDLEEVDGALINDLLHSLKRLTDDFGKKLEKPDIPEPAPRKKND